MAILEADHLTKDYRNVRALDDLTVQLEGGTIGLLGPNGAGKSTFIKLLLGYLVPTRGTARILGLDPRHASLKIRQQIGYMPEVESYVPGMNAVAFVTLAGKLNGMFHQDAMQRTHMVLNFVGLDEERYRPIESYSTGMKQKVKFAQAIVHHPKLLLLDEPTTGLDPRAREEMLQLIRDVARGSGMDVMLSTHLLHDVETVCDRVVILDKGRMIAQDELRNLKRPTDASFEVHVQGNEEAFRSALAKYGGEAKPMEEGGLCVLFTDPSPNTEPILRAAVESGVQLRHLSRPQNTLESLFERVIRENA